MDYCYHCGQMMPCCPDCGNCPRSCTCQDDEPEEVDDE